MFSFKNLIILGVGIGFFIFGILLTYSRDVSLPYNVWVNDWFSSTYSKSDYIIIEYSKNDPFFPHKRLVKQITCVSGELIRKVGDGVFCDDVWLGNALKVSKNGQKLPNIELNNIIQTDEYFVTGTHKRSYDSRYFGLIHKDLIVRRVIPLRELFSFIRSII